MPRPSIKNSKTESSVVIKQATFAVKIQFVMKGLQTNSQQLGGSGFIIFCLLQGAHAHLPLHFFQGRSHRQRNSVFIPHPFALLDWVWSEVMSFDLLAGTDNDGTLDYIAQLTHVTGPGMKLEGIQRRGTQKTGGAMMLLCKLSYQVLCE